jgi:hypothetical protein
MLKGSPEGKKVISSRFSSEVKKVFSSSLALFSFTEKKSLPNNYFS